ncbi:nicotinate-nucleotide pyrophosphorylase [carboxylating] [Ekhidna lutea]|uniref:Probable nicotinate-nucleotide pyrophosphorylase [carboxylating] n=1 Tax=Ekhidna lutea TaxID=447679 RepID=A0A239ESX3_EKHLU|nr:carboxylating nicotinate-nucleotide diphosphorylase [Ekhidna lutea]SNS47755.1 nicotinate-nucleotide pyrophosphorylase [carboxylating] [Ekhidna lutea]
MNLPYLTTKNINAFIKNALAEDIGNGDHSSLGSITEDARSKAHLIIKDDGIIAGVELAEKIFNHVDSNLNIEFNKKDGDPIENGEIGFSVEGSSRSILSSERLVLNCLQRMSGIATYTHHMNQLIKGTKARLLDTRKTTPLFRMAEKWAVVIGGGVNHRFGLYDMVMLKDNHIDFAGGVKNAINQTVDYLEKNDLKLNIEVEVRSLKELDEVLAVGKVHRVMLDNMLPSDIRQAIKMIGGRFETEASGGITEKTIAEIAETGVDFISVGALTHSYKSLDMSLKAI